MKKRILKLKNLILFNLPTIGIYSTDVIKINAILKTYIGYMNEYLLCLNVIATYKKSIMTTNMRNIKM